MHHGCAAIMHGLAKYREFGMSSVFLAGASAGGTASAVQVENEGLVWEVSGVPEEKAPARPRGTPAEKSVGTDSTVFIPLPAVFLLAKRN